MRRGATRFLLAAAALTVAASSASAWYVVAGGAVNAVVASPGAAAFNVIFAINPNAGAFGPGTAGDVILGIEEGRDYNSHFATIAVNLSPANPFTGVLAAGGIVPPMNGLYGPPPPGFVQVQMVYRATNDPVNPGWAALPGGATQVADDVAACHAVAEQLTLFRASAAAGIGGVGAVWPWMDIETDLLLANASYFEFYKFRTVH